MAHPHQVKQYLAFWFQLGKPVILHYGQSSELPQPIYQSDRYSPEFEACWQRIFADGGKGCYLDGTVQTIEELLSSSWEITPCARCDMPVPMLSLGFRSDPCPCSDLATWPNNELPQPRSPIDNRSRLAGIRERLQQQNQSSAKT